MIHSFATLAALQCEDHIGRAENSEPALEAGGRIEAAGVGAGGLWRPGRQESCRGQGVRGVTGGGPRFFIDRAVRSARIVRGDSGLFAQKREL